MILVVEDCAETRAALRLLLEHEGHEVKEASDGLTACDVLAGGATPRLVFLDLEMPGGSGADCLRAIKGVCSPWADVPVAILTGAEVALGGDEALADRVLVKPAAPGELLALAAEYDPPGKP
jgi:CheY-like chemotaxis protein